MGKAGLSPWKIGRNPLRLILCLIRGMSVYRKFAEGPPSESLVFSDKRMKVVRAPKSPKSDASLDEQAQHRRRKAAPTNELLDAALQWAARLPRSVQPLALMRRFPRIANQLAASWSDAPSVRSYLEDLLVDHRGNRKGFPPEFLRELLALRLYHETLHPQELSVWGRRQAPELIALIETMITKPNRAT